MECSGPTASRDPTASQVESRNYPPDRLDHDPDYAAALDFLFGRIDYERIGHPPYTPNNFRLERMRQLVGKLGNPQSEYPVVHIAGTKGKGTVAHLLSEGLGACGLRTGLYTSPHLVSLEERFRIDGVPATSKQLIELTHDVRLAAEEVERQGAGRATFFELTTAMGLLHFAKQSVDCAVLEVGLGGRLDSTNICEPALCAITSISLDHQKQLGNTIAQIASEKAGIIKHGIPVVCSARHPQARSVIETIARGQSASLQLIERDYEVAWDALECVDDSHAVAEVTVADVDDEDSSFRVQCRTRLLGRHQADNLAAVIACRQQLERQGWSLPRERFVAAIADAHPPARLQTVGNNPLQILDTAHNEDSLRAGLSALQTHFPGCKLTAVFASSRDKDYLGMLRLLLPACETLILTNYLDNPRGLPCEELEQACAQLISQSSTTTPASTVARRELPDLRLARGSSDNCSDANVPCRRFVADTPRAAWQLALELTDPQSGLVYATGSFFLAAELLALRVGTS